MLFLDSKITNVHTLCCATFKNGFSASICEISYFLTWQHTVTANKFLRIFFLSISNFAQVQRPVHLSFGRIFPFIQQKIWFIRASLLIPYLNHLRSIRLDLVSRRTFWQMEISEKLFIQQQMVAFTFACYWEMVMWQSELETKWSRKQNVAQPQGK